MCPTSPELSVDPPDARRLLEAMARGDTTAIGALYDRFAPLLLAVTDRILQNRPEAEGTLALVLYQGIEIES